MDNLSSILHVQCCSCKRFRIDGEWVPLILESDNISHGICQECVLTLYPFLNHSGGMVGKKGESPLHGLNVAG